MVTSVCEPTRDQRIQGCWSDGGCLRVVTDGIPSVCVGAKDICTSSRTGAVSLGGGVTCSGASNRQDQRSRVN